MGRSARADDFDGAVAFGEGERLDGGGDLDAVDDKGLGRGRVGHALGRGLLLGDGRAGAEQPNYQGDRGVSHSLRMKDADPRHKESSML